MSAIGMRGATVVLAVAIAISATGPALAFRATTVGQLFTPGNTNCTGSTEVIQTGVASGNSYTVPSPGVITSWSFQENATTVAGLKLKVARSADGSNFTFVGESTAGPQTPNAVNTYPTRITVQTGDQIGIFEIAGGCDSTTSSAADTVALFAGTDTPLGSTAPLMSSSNFKLPVAATVEPDADRDGFGDETQDLCFTDPSTQGMCPAPAIVGVAQTGQSLMATPNGSPTNPSYQWVRCDAAGANCSAISGATGPSYNAAAADLGLTLRFRKTATDGSGTQVTDSAQTAVVSMPARVVPPPTVTGALMTRTRFAVTRFATPIAARKKPPRGSAFLYTLNAAATVKIRIFVVLPGGKTAGRCVPQTKRTMTRHACTRLALKGTLIRQGTAGHNTVAFSGRIGARALKAGRYQAAIVAANLGGTSTKQTVSFTIVKP